MGAPGDDRRLSKAMAWWLRHAPDTAGLPVDPAGWAAVDALVGALSRRLPGVRADDVVRVARAGEAGEAKPRYELRDDGRWIRARYGHSRDVDLGLRPSEPPDVLYHGTAARNVDAILREGLQPRSRQAVHLSETVSDAVAVGTRHGPPAVLAVDARSLQAGGHPFFRAAPGFWMVAYVPAEALRAM